MDPRYKLPKLTYCGTLPPAKHYIRKTQTPVIQEVSASESKAKQLKQEKKKKMMEKTHVASYEIFALNEKANEKPQKCTRIPSVEGGKAFSMEALLKEAPVGLQVTITFEIGLDASSSKDIELQLYEEFVSVKAPAHQDLSESALWIDRKPKASRIFLFPKTGFYLPYPVKTESVEAFLEQNGTILRLQLQVEKEWNTSGPGTFGNFFPI